MDLAGCPTGEAVAEAANDDEDDAPNAPKLDVGGAYAGVDDGTGFEAGTAVSRKSKTFPAGLVACAGAREELMPEVGAAWKSAKSSKGGKTC